MVSETSLIPTVEGPPMILEAKLLPKKGLKGSRKDDDDEPLILPELKRKFRVLRPGFFEDSSKEE